MNPEESPLKQIRTFQGDAAEALQRQQSSLVSIQRAEHLKGGAEFLALASSEELKKRKHFFLFLLGSIVLLIMGAAGGWYAYTEFAKSTITPITTTPGKLLSSNTEVSLLVETAATREALINALSSAVGTVSLGELKHLVLKKTGGEETSLLSISEFLKILESRAPASLIRAFDPLFMFGALGSSNFLIIKLTSFENAFAGMFAWEKDVARDIGPLFTTAPLLRDVPPESIFIDVTDRNKDIRMLALGNQSVLLYSFFDNNMLIITDNIETLRTLADRLTREKLSR